VSSLHLGVYVGAGGSAALYRGYELAQRFEERALTRAEPPGGRYDGPGGQSSGLTDPWGHRSAQLPREAIRACLKGADVGWDRVHSVTIVGPEGSRDRFLTEYADHRGFSSQIQLIEVSGQVALSHLALCEHGLQEALCLVMRAEASEGEVNAYALMQLSGAEVQPLYTLKTPKQLSALQSPTLAYMALIHRARAQLDVPDTQDHHPLEWATQLASYSTASLPQLKPWFTASPNSYELQVSSYDMWLEVLCLERRFQAESVKLGAQRPQRRALWASIIAKAQRELGASLSTVTRYAQRETPGQALIFTGELALDPKLAEYVRQAGGPSTHISRLSSDVGVAMGAAALGATRASHAPSSTRPSLSLNAKLETTLVNQSLKQLRPPLSAERCEPVELGKRFARRLRKGGLIGYFDGPAPLGYAPQVNRLCLMDPSSARALASLNQSLDRDLDAPTYLLCPAEQAEHIFEGAKGYPPRELILCAPKEEHREALYATLRGDGRVALLPLDLERDPLLCELCEALSLHFNRLPVLLSAPLTLSSRRRASYPSDALHALSTGSLDALLMGSMWVESALSSQRLVAPSLQDEHLSSLDALPLMMRDFPGELEALDQLIFSPEQLSLEWSPEALSTLSRELAPYRMTSRIFERHPLLGQLDPQEVTPGSEGLIFSLNPRGMSKVIDESGRWSARLYPWPQAATLLSLTKERRLQEGRLSRRLHLPPSELATLIRWGIAELEALGVCADPSWRRPPSPARPPLQPQGELLLAPFQDPQLNLREELSALWRRLVDLGYSEERLTPFRGEAPPRALTQDPADQLIRFFWRGEPQSRPALLALLGEQVMTTLLELGILIGKDDLRSQLRIDCVAGALIASDHLHPLSRTGSERLIPALTPQERGLVRLGLSKRGGRTLDLSETIGGVAITQSRVVRPIDVIVSAPRAYRFTQFNLQLNGVEVASLELSAQLHSPRPHLYDQVFTRSPELLRVANDYLKPRGRVISSTEDIAQTAKVPVSLLHHALGLPLCSGEVSLDDPRLSLGFEGHAGYWVIEHRGALEDPSAWVTRQASTPLHRPLRRFPCERLHEYLDHYFTPPLTASELAYPHPSITLLKESLLGDKKRFSASNDSWRSLSALMIHDEVYAQLKSLMVQRQASPVTQMSADLVRLGLMVTKRQPR